MNPSDDPTDGRILDQLMVRAVAAETTAWRPEVALVEVAEALLEHDAEIVSIAAEESGFGTELIRGELGRTAAQLRQFAAAAADRTEWDELFTPADTTTGTMSMWRTALPVGVVVVFTASNFPLAFGAVGTDTGAALAAGCPVVVKPHPLHPATDALVVSIARDALASGGWAPERLLLATGSTVAVGQSLVRHPLVSAVSFTGSYAGGRALMDLVAARPQPIPVYAEMSSSNPVLLSSAAMTERFDELAVGAAQSLTTRHGQLCTKPGLFFIPGPDRALTFASALADAASAVLAVPLLSPGMSATYKAATDTARRLTASVHPADEPHDVDDDTVVPTVALVPMADFAQERFWRSEHFGPFAVVVACADEAEALSAIEGLDGSLVSTLQVGANEGDLAIAAARRMARRSGRVVLDGWPTGVPVARATVHAGPFPSANTGLSAVGASAIRRYLRPVTFQGFDSPLPPDEDR